MKITLNRITPTSTISSSILLKRATTSTRRSDSVHYLAILDPEELAFISLEIPENKIYLHVYEIFVEEKFRRKGYGTKIVEEIFMLAKLHDRKEICLTPISLDCNIPTESLILWYESLGFKKMQNSDEMFEFKFKPNLT